MKCPLIYIAYCRISKKSYIGQTIDFLSRKRAHLNSAKAGREDQPKLHRAIRKYGAENFEWSILQYCAGFSKEDLDRAEKNWILKYDSIENGYNCLDGGVGISAGYRLSMETRARMSDAAKKRGPDHYRRGYKHSPESRAKIAAMARGRRHSQEAKDKMSKSKMGRPSGRLGEKASPELRAKLSAAHLGRSNGPHSQETRAKMSAARRRKLDLPLVSVG